MKPPRKYASATAFRVALEGRLKRLAQEESLDLQRVLRQAAFDRLLGQLFAKPAAPWLFKGAYAMELCLEDSPHHARYGYRIETTPGADSGLEC